MSYQFSVRDAEVSVGNIANGIEEAAQEFVRRLQACQTIQDIGPDYIDDHLGKELGYVELPVCIGEDKGSWDLVYIAFNGYCNLHEVILQRRSMQRGGASRYVRVVDNHDIQKVLTLTDPRGGPAPLFKEDQLEIIRRELS